MNQTLSTSSTEHPDNSKPKRRTTRPVPTAQQPALFDDYSDLPLIYQD